MSNRALLVPALLALTFIGTYGPAARALPPQGNALHVKGAGVTEYYQVVHLEGRQLNGASATGSFMFQGENGRSFVVVGDIDMMGDLSGGAFAFEGSGDVTEYDSIGEQAYSEPVWYLGTGFDGGRGPGSGDAISVEIMGDSFYFSTDDFVPLKHGGFHKQFLRAE